MSRGYGKLQKAILDAIETSEGRPVVITNPGDTHAQQNSLRRAATSLEVAGKIVIRSARIDGQPRLVAFTPDQAPIAVERGSNSVVSPGAELPRSENIIGMDGKNYRRAEHTYQTTPKPARQGNKTAKILPGLIDHLAGQRMALESIRETDTGIPETHLEAWRSEVKLSIRELQRIEKLLRK